MTSIEGSVGRGPSYHARAAEKVFKKVLKEKPESAQDQVNPERIGVLRDLFGEFFREETDNIQIFRTQEGVAVPYTRINLTDFAKKLYQKYSPDHKEPVLYSETDTPTKHRYVVFSSFPVLQNGHPFTFDEVAMRHTARLLGPVLDKIAAGKQPPDIEFMTMGAPINNRWGEVTSEYVEKAEGDPIGTLSKTYAEMIKAAMPEDEEDLAKLSYVFHGISMGGRFALKTAEALMKEGVMTQDRDDKSLPHVKVLIESMPGTNKRGGKVQVPIGFLLDGTLLTVRHPSWALVMKRENDFLTKVEEDLEQRGIFATGTNPDLTEEENKQHRKAQDAMKKKIKNAINGSLGVPIEDDQPIKAEHHMGIYDPLSFTPRRFMKGKENLQRGIKVHTEIKNNLREWPERALHLIPTFPKDIVRRWTRSVDTLLALQKK
jgi:hypothetical protein